jgi:hypothetical protein
MLMCSHDNYNHANPFQNGRGWDQSVARAMQALPARQRRCASARMPLMPKRQRVDADAKARQHRGASAAIPRTSAAMSRRQRGDAEAPSPRRRRFVATTELRLGVAGCSCLSRWLQRFTNVDQRAHNPGRALRPALRGKYRPRAWPCYAERVTGDAFIRPGDLGTGRRDASLRLAASSREKP